MNKLFRDRAFELSKLYFQSLSTWEFVNDKWAMAGLREVKRFFGLLRHECPLCQAKMPYYVILCQARDASGEPVGNPKPLPLYTKNGGFLPVMLLPLGSLQFGVCPSGHETARIYVNSGGGDGFDGYLIHQFRADKMVQIACP